MASNNKKKTTKTKTQKTYRYIYIACTCTKGKYTHIYMYTNEYTCNQMEYWNERKKNNDVHISWYKIYCVDHQTNCDIHSFNTKKNNDFLKVNKTKHLHTHVSHAHIKNWRGCKSLQNFEILVM